MSETGQKTVPVEPTLEMLKAGYDALQLFFPEHTGHIGQLRVWEAMLAAAPDSIRLPQSNAALVEALRDAFPHFQNDEPVTPETIKKIGQEYFEMVMGWEPSKTEIEFFDQNGTTRTLVYEDGEDSGGWTIPDAADWEVSALANA